MEKLIYIQVHKLEQEALDAINKLYRQGFRRDQVSALAYNTDRFNTLYKEAAVPMDKKEDKLEEVPDEVLDAVTPDVVVPLTTPSTAGYHHVGLPYVTTLPAAGLATLNLDNDSLLVHERSLQEGDILVILQTDEGQEYRPDLPLVHEEGYVPERTEL